MAKGGVFADFRARQFLVQAVSNSNPRKPPACHLRWDSVYEMERGMFMQDRLFGLPEPKGTGSGRSFQARSSHQGRLVEETAVDVLEASGFEVIDERFELGILGVEVNLVGRDRLGNKWFIEVTGAYGSRRPGLVRTDTVRKILGSAQLLSKRGFKPFLVITTDLPTPGSRGDRMLRAAGPGAIFDIVLLHSREDRDRLRKYAKRGYEAGPVPGWWAQTEIQEHAISSVSGSAIDLSQKQDWAPLTGQAARLPHSLRLLVPSRDRLGRPLNRVVRAAFIDDFVKWCATRNGGLVRQSADGSWTDAQGDEVDEHLSVVESWGSSPVQTSELQPFLQRMFSELDQATVSLVVDGTMILMPRLSGDENESASGETQSDRTI